MKTRLLLAVFVFFSVLPVLASACTTHDQCSEACNSLGYGSCPYGVYGCMVRDCCIGQCNYWETNQCFCLHTTHVDIYGDVCPSGSFCGSDCRCHPTQPVPVCNVGETRNRRCACSTQVYYEVCDGSNWNAVTENCPSGTVCSSGYCVPLQTCTQMYLNNYRCSGNWAQRQYQYSDCNTTWLNYEYCDNGCSGGHCLQTPECTPGYLDSFRCEGKWVQRKYLNSDCSTTWVNWMYCSNDCYSDQCWYEKACSVDVEVETPNDAVVGDVVATTVTIRKTGYESGYVHFDAYVCSVDPACQRMSCDGNDDPWVYLRGHETYSITCTAKIDSENTYEVKVVYSGCDSGTVYSGRFDVKEAEKPKCVADFIDIFRCSGEWRQQLYRYSDCSTAWVSLEKCYGGCSEGSCLPVTTTTLPVTTTTLPATTTTTAQSKNVTMPTGWTVVACKINPVLIVLFLLFLALLLLLLRKECICYRKGPRRANMPEFFNMS